MDVANRSKDVEQIIETQSTGVFQAAPWLPIGMPLSAYVLSEISIGREMRKKVDGRIRTLIENGVKSKHRSMFVIIGDKSRDQVLHSFEFLQIMPSKKSKKKNISPQHEVTQPQLTHPQPNQPQPRSRPNFVKLPADCFLRIYLGNYLRNFLPKILPTKVLTGDKKLQVNPLETCFLRKFSSNSQLSSPDGRVRRSKLY